MWNQLRYKFAMFMQGRYGTDNLNRFLSGVTLVVLMINMFVNSRILGWITVALLVLLYFRTFSRNISKRYAEGQKYDAIVVKVKAWFAQQQWKITHLKEYIATKNTERAQNKDYHIYKCPRCSQKIRIPKGKGHIMVTCPKCKFEFHKKS